MPNVSIKLLREGAKLPVRGSASAAGYDLYACLDGDQELTIPPHSTAMLPTGLSFALPEGTFGAVVARSGLASKQGLRPANCLGVIDSDYRGEIQIGLHNLSAEPYTVQPGERIAQMIIMPYFAPVIEEVTSLTETDRGAGGFGSTGTK
jgi:dUTP pyrophosphatase